MEVGMEEEVAVEEGSEVDVVIEECRGYGDSPVVEQKKQLEIICARYILVDIGTLLEIFNGVLCPSSLYSG